MLYNYVKTVYRHIGRSKINFAFKLGGLALALFSLLIVTIYVSYQWSFDRFHDNYENIYRVNSNRYEDGNLVPYSMLPPAIGPALKQEFPEVVSFTRLGVASKVVIKYNDKLLLLSGFVDADSSVFDVLKLNIIKGSKKSFSQPGSIILTESLAKQIFGDEDPINKVIISVEHNNRPLLVRAVMEDFPTYSHLKIRALLSIQNNEATSWDITWDGSLNLYVRLAPQANPDELSSKALPLIRKNLSPTEDGSEKRFSIYLQPIADIYLSPELTMEFSKKGSTLYVYIFSLLGVFLLIIAGINYVNLSIADFDSRTREMGVRKVLGARKRQIGVQVVFETLIVTIAALVLAVGFLYLLFPQISRLLDSNLRFDMLLNKSVLIATGGIVFLLIACSSAYPAYRVLLQNTSQELKSNSGYVSVGSLGKSLLLAQYLIAIICICATLVVDKQVSFVQQTDVGYDRHHVVSLVMPDEYPSENVAVLRNELSRLAGIQSVSYSYYLMPISTYFKGSYEIERDGKMEKRLVNEMFVDHDYFETMGIHLIAGRNFDRANASDVNTGFIVNEAAVKAFGWEDALGKKIRVSPDGEQKSNWEGTVIGVVKNFNTLSLHNQIEPVVLRLPWDSWPGNSLNVRTEGSLSAMLPEIIKTYEKHMPGFLADARVLDDLYKNQYQEEDKAFASLQIATVIIVLISSLGMFSLSLYMSVKRMKEFGIRKVLGASVQQIAALHTGYFFKIILLANAIAIPVAYWLMNGWLNEFAYRTNPDAGIFLSVIGISFLLVIVSGAYPAWKSGRMNPVDVIKS